MRKFLLSLAALLSLVLSVNASTKTYQLVTDIADLQNPANKFIIIKPGTTTYTPFYSLRIYTAASGSVSIMGNSLSKSHIQYEPSTEIVPNTISIDLEKNYDTNCIFSIRDNGSSKVLYDNVSGKYFTFYKDADNAKTDNARQNITLLDEVSPDNPLHQFSIDIDPDTYGVIFKSHYNEAEYNFCFNGTSSFYNINTSNIEGNLVAPENKNSTTGKYTYPLFYKDVTPVAAPEFGGYDSRGFDVELYQTLSLEGKITPKALTYNFTTDDTDIIEIDNETKSFKALSLGKATINFTTEAVPGEYEAGSGSFTINVTKITPALHFADQVVFGKLNKGVVWDPVIVTNPANEEDRGKITYTSSNPDIVSINEETGRILPDDVKNTGVVTITATMEESEKYFGGSASYKVLIKDPDGAIESGTTIFDFTTLNPYGMTSSITTLSSGYETEVKEILGDDITTLTFDGQYMSYIVSSYKGTYELRLNNSATTKITINVPEGYTISAIGMTGTSFNGAYTPTSDSATTEDPDEWDSDVTLTWHATPGVDVTQVEFEPRVQGAARINTIWVQYQPANAPYESADLSFGKVVNNIIMDEEAVINAVRNPNGLEISYSIVGLEDDEYSITPSEDGKTMKVLVKKPGFYTLQATSPAGDGYRDGFAIMRLNVYRHLDVYANDKEVTDETIDTTDRVIVTFEVPDLAKVFWQIIDDADPTIPDTTPTDDEDQEVGFQLYEDGIEIPKGLDGKLILYIANYGYASPKRTILLGDAEVVPTPEIEIADDNFHLEGNYITGKGTVKISLKAAEGHDIYYSLGSKSTRKYVKSHAATRAAGCSDNHEGYTLHDGKDIELTSKHSTLSVYACNPLTGVHSTPQTYELSLQTAVAEIEINEGEAAYYSIDGQKIEATKLVPGIYIRIKDGKTTKVLVK